MIPWLALFTSAAWVDFTVIVLSKFIPLTKSLDKWYAEFGIVAAGTDVLIIVLGIALSKLIFPGIHGWPLIQVAVLIQIVHDILFYGLIVAIPSGHNKILDLFKQYASEGGWKILAADAAMIAGTVLLMEWLDNTTDDTWIAFLGVLALYSLLYIVYTK